MVEQSAVNRLVVGSNPTWGASLIIELFNLFLRVGNGYRILGKEKYCLDRYLTH